MRDKLPSPGFRDQEPWHVCIRLSVGGDDRVPARWSFVCPLQHSDPRCWCRCRGRGGQQSARLDLMLGLIDVRVYCCVQHSDLDIAGRQMGFIGPCVSELVGFPQAIATQCGGTGGFARCWTCVSQKIRRAKAGCVLQFIVLFFS